MVQHQGFLPTAFMALLASPLGRRLALFSESLLIGFLLKRIRFLFQVVNFVTKGLIFFAEFFDLLFWLAEGSD